MRLLLKSIYILYKYFILPLKFYLYHFAIYIVFFFSIKIVLRTFYILQCHESDKNHRPMLCRMMFLTRITQPMNLILSL